MALHGYHADAPAVSDQGPEYRRKNRRAFLDIGRGRRAAQLRVVEQGQLAVFAKSQHRQRGRMVQRIRVGRIHHAILDVVDVVQRVAVRRQKRHAEGIHRQQRGDVFFHRHADRQRIQAHRQVLADITQQPQRFGRRGEFVVGLLQCNVRLPARDDGGHVAGHVVQQVEVGLRVGNVRAVALHDDQAVHAVLRDQRRAHPAVEIHHAAWCADLARRHQRFEQCMVHQPWQAAANHQG